MNALQLPPTPYALESQIRANIESRKPAGAGASRRHFLKRAVRFARVTLPSGYGRAVNVIGGAL